MRTTLGKALRLTGRDCWEISLAYVYLTLAWWRLSVRKEKLDRWVLEGARPAERVAPPGRMDNRYLSHSARWVNVAARYPLPWARCLQRSLALCLLLRRRGFTSQLKIGVRKNGDSLEAHAWVEYYGRVLNDSQNVYHQFTLMNAGQSLPSARQLSKAIRG